MVDALLTNRRYRHCCCRGVNCWNMGMRLRPEPRASQGAFWALRPWVHSSQPPAPVTQAPRSWARCRNLERLSALSQLRRARNGTGDSPSLGVPSCGAEQERTAWMPYAPQRVGNLVGTWNKRCDISDGALRRRWQGLVERTENAVRWAG